MIPCPTTGRPLRVSTVDACSQAICPNASVMAAAASSRLSAISGWLTHARAAASSSGWPAFSPPGHASAVRHSARRLQSRGRARSLLEPGCTGIARHAPLGPAHFMRRRARIGILGSTVLEGPLMRWRVLVVVAAGLAAVVPLPPALVERYYSTLLYPSIQRTLTGLSNLTDLALLDALIAAALAVWVLLFLRDVVVRRGRTARRPLVRLVLRTATAAACFYLLFLVTWGLNYRRLPLAQKLELDAASVSPQGAVDLATMAVAEMNRLYPIAAEAREARELRPGGLAGAGICGDSAAAGCGRAGPPGASEAHVAQLVLPARGDRWHDRPLFPRDARVDGAPAGGTADRHRPRVGASGRVRGRGRSELRRMAGVREGVAARPLQRVAVSLQPDGRWTAVVRAVADRRRHRCRSAQRPPGDRSSHSRRR